MSPITQKEEHFNKLKCTMFGLQRPLLIKHNVYMIYEHFVAFVFRMFKLFTQ